ncbi:PREDICTED: uncharacterized protein LOC107355997 [Acropora digitifera]|uniref:uncharacterized protein LOC107355997 n=1 Tax=Acropora digitifera TaxID=70779 RepID=UPI00077AC220|nr:PREDICTED: uncharacterized protein LOC107355997 [Acropora digitifera]
MPRLCKFLVSLVLLIFLIRRCIGHCAQEMCEKKSLNLATDTKRNLFLRGYVLETLSFSSWKDCYLFCMRNCQCLSFNFYESSNKTLNCELNEANTKIVPEALVKKEGVTYYEPVRTYAGLEESPQQLCSERFCNNRCCATTPCQHGGTCSEVCEINKRRFRCTCASRYTGHRCQFEVTQSQLTALPVAETPSPPP